MNCNSFRTSTRKWLASVGLALLCLAGVATAVTPKEVRKQVEASMLLSGTISIEADGSVRGYGIDNEAKVPDYVLSNIEKWVPTWRFKPVLVDGKPMSAQAKMSLRMRAEPSGDDKFSLYISGATFGASQGLSTDCVTKLEMKPPRFPPDVARVGGKGVVYLILKVDRQGAVEDVVAEQVNLTAYASDRQMERFRRSLADAAIEQAREWTFRPPTTGEQVDDEWWSVRVPVDFAYRDEKEVAYGQWEGYLPGPRQRAPWLEGPEGEIGSDALASGALQMVGTGPRLLTPPQG